MKIKIFNENGITKVVKILDNNFEANMFHIQDGEVVVIEIENSICIKGVKYNECRK